MAEQLTIAQFKALQSHANRGETFQRMLDHAHSLYRRLGWGRIERRERIWLFTSQQHALKQHENNRAETGHGRWLVAAQSDVDYSGVLLKRPISFDAKQFQRVSIPLINFTPHQVEKLCADEHAGAVAGFMIYRSDTGQVYWLRASQVRDAKDRVIFSTGRGRHPKSCSVSWLTEHSLVIGTFRPGELVDYAGKLLDQTPSSAIKKEKGM